MSPIAPVDALSAGFSTSPIPPRAHDGGLELEPAPVSLRVIQPISICELGPCRNYHRLAQKIDAERPIDGSEAPVYVAITKTCYPSPGIEYDLTGEPVKECSRWAPMSDALRLELDESRVGWSEIGAWRDGWREFVASWSAVTDPDPK